MDLTHYAKPAKDRSKKAPIDITPLVYGKIPPNAKPIEDAVLGAMMLDAGAFDKVAGMLRPQVFYSEANGIIYQAIQLLSQKSQPIDHLTVTNQLQTDGTLDIVGGPYYVTQLTNAVVSSASIEGHARILVQKWIGRALIALAGETLQLAYDDSMDIFELLEGHEKTFTEISLSTGASTYTSLDNELVKALNRIGELRKLDGLHLTGTTSGFRDLDRVTHGWQDTDLIILAARPSVGKTAFALNMARAAAGAGKSVGFFSLEMNKGQLVNRLLSAESGIYLERISNGLLDEVQMKALYEHGVQALARMKAKIYFDDTAAITGWELRRRAREMARKHGVKMIIVDYLQLMGSEAGSRQNREQVVSQNTRELKNLAKELKIPIIALSQLSREPEKRKGRDKMPWLADLRESGGIEQDADVVTFMYRPEYYGDPGSYDQEDNTGETLITMAKHRNGRIITQADAIRVRAKLAIQKFYDWEESGPAPKQGSLLEDTPPAQNKPKGGKWAPIDHTISNRERDDDDLPFPTFKP